MAMSSVANSHVLAMMVFETWLGEHPQFLEERPAGVDGNEDQEKRRSRTMAIWQDFCDLYQRFAQWTEQWDDRKPDPSPLWQLAAITHSLGLSDEMWNAALLLRNRRPEIGMRGAPKGMAATGGRHAGSDVSPKFAAEMVGENRVDALEQILREIVAELKRIVRWQERRETHEPLTEPLSLQELAKLFHCHRNQVKANVLSKYKPEMVGKKYRMPLRHMPPSYFRQTPSSVPEVENR